MMKEKRTVSWAALAAVTAAVAALYLWRGVVVEAVYPVERAVRGVVVRIGGVVTGLSRGVSAELENARLRRELAALRLKAGDLARATAENARLRRALGYVVRQPGAWLAAGVLSFGGGAAGAGRTLRVDRGSLAGVAVGAVVVVPEGVVGRVVSVSPHTAEVALVTDGRVQVACEVETEAPLKPRGILCGGTGDALALRHLSNATAGPSRLKVFTSGLGGVFPRGLPVGTLLEVREGGEDLACVGDVQPAVLFESLGNVFIRRES